MKPSLMSLWGLHNYSDTRLRRFSVFRQLILEDPKIETYLTDCFLLFTCFPQTEAPVVLTQSGRPKRRSRKVVDYTETEKDTPYDLEKYLERVRKEQEQRFYIFQRHLNSLPPNMRTRFDSNLLSCLPQLLYGAGCPKSAGCSDQPKAAEHPHAAKEML